MPDRHGGRCGRRHGILLTIVAGIVAVCLLTSGCSLIWPIPPSPPVSDPSLPPSRDYSSEYSGGWCYQRLTPALRADYAAVYGALRDTFDQDHSVLIADSESGIKRKYTGLRVELPQPLGSREEAQKLFLALTWDNPQFYYIANTYSYEGYRAGGKDYYNIFCLVFSMNADERGQAQQQLDAVLAELDSGWQAAGLKGDFEAELFYHDRLLELCTYDTEAAAQDNPASRFPQAFTAYGALVEGKAVCEGYSRAMQLLLHRAGMECTLVNGFDKNNTAHMWNMVTVNGRNYHLDPTWNDSEQQPQHVYFNLTSEEILRTHTIDNENIGIDTCTAQAENYYLRTKAYVSRLSLDKMADIAAMQLSQGKNAVEFRFATQDGYLRAQRFVNSKTLFFDAVNDRLKGSGLTLWDYENYSTNDDYFTIVIYPPAEELPGEEGQPSP
ncbi:MAG: hypothetical protein HFJ80_07915 [Clostridiales bacterium]|nr:hypothetical protein [Clostridiales bacterium]